MKVVFFGTPNFAIPTLERLLENTKFEVVAVVTQPDKRRGRGNKTTASPVKNAATAQNIPVFSPQRLKKDAETLSQLRDLNADVFVVIAYGQILSQEILDLPRLGCINVHGSILPKYRGAAPINWCLYHGETQTGITTILMDAGMDTGAMLLKATIPIKLSDNAQDLAIKLANLGADLLIETLIKWEHQEIIPIPQDNAQATYAPLIQKSDYILDWSKSAIALQNQVRGFFPNCTTTIRGQLLKVLAIVPLDTAVITLPNFGAPGTVVGIVKGMGAAIQTGAGVVLLTEVQLASKKPQSGVDFINGNRLTVGEVLS